MQPHTDEPRPATSNGDPAGHEETIPQDLPKVGTGKVIVATIVFVLLLAALFVIGLVPHNKREARINAEAAEARDARPVVKVVRVMHQDHGSDLVLPADVRPLKTTSIFPRASGYLAKQYVDIGDSVKEGQLLAEIDAPEIDAQLAQAKAAVQQQEANVSKAKNDNELAQQTFVRYRDFGKTGGVTQQQVDEKNAAASQAEATYKAAQATLASANAEVQRLSSIQGFQKIYAPFGGTITARNFDLGALLSSSNATREMFRIEQNDTLRVYVQVPQAYATAITIGLPADLLVTNYPGQAFGGKVVRSSDTIDENTRTIRYEIDVPNPDGKLFAGMYGQIKFKIKPASPPLIVPTSALVFNDKGLRVATVDGDGKVKFMPISVGRDFGTEVEVQTGLKGDEQIVANPGERLADGVEVKTVGETGQGGGNPRVAEAAH